MAKLPDGWLFVPKVSKKLTTIEITEQELIMCRNCEEYKEWGDTMCCMRLGSYYGNTMPTDYCSYAKKREEHHD